MVSPKFWNTAVVCLLSQISFTQAWTSTTRVSPRRQGRTRLSLNDEKLAASSDALALYDPLNLFATETQVSAKTMLVSTVALWGAAPLASTAATVSSNAVPSALAAYGHYLSLITMVGCLMVERLTIEPDMTAKKEDFLVITDSLYGISAAVLLYTGYLRVTEFEKGWIFYRNEPIFWVKMLFFWVVGAASFFNTTILVRRAIQRRDNSFDFVPMGEPLSARMTQLCNAQLTGIAIIPLTAALMARGVGYSDSNPWMVEALFVALAAVGLSFKYIKEALTFEDVPPSSASEAAP